MDGRRLVKYFSPTHNSPIVTCNMNPLPDFADTDDRIQILDCDNTRTYQEPMSQTRRICFFASIAATILVVIVFLLLPCESGCVAKSPGILKTRNWIRSYEKMELKGEINSILPTTAHFPRNILFMYRPDKIFPDVNAANKKSKQKSNGGIIALSGSSGEIAWNKEMSTEPMAADCNLIDCDKSGTKDCLVVDELGQLACVGTNGHQIYNFNLSGKATKQTRRDLLLFPLILPDLNNDKVNEILMTAQNGRQNSTDLILVSGATGKALMREAQNCSALHKLQMDEDYVVKFVCINDKKEQQIFRNLTDLYSFVSKKPLNLKKLEAVSRINQHQYNGKQIGTSSAQNTISEVEDKKLIVENTGSWPRDSRATIKVFLKINDGLTRQLFNRTYNKAYAMTPIPISLNSSSTTNGKNVHGFVIKLWIWNGTDVSYNLEKNRKSERDSNVKSQRSNYTNQTTFATPVQSYKTKIHYLKESIMLIVFNSTNMKFENTSQSSIVQFCQKTTNGRDKKNATSSNDAICQPDLSNQENSILITDIDGDGSKELVSFYSTFVNENESKDVTNDQWKLKTYVQLFKLESELPQLYADLNIY